jgi:hypothetical protein
MHNSALKKQEGARYTFHGGKGAAARIRIKDEAATLQP